MVTGVLARNHKTTLKRIKSNAALQINMNNFIFQNFLSNIFEDLPSSVNLYTNFDFLSFFNALLALKLKSTDFQVIFFLTLNFR